MLKAVIFDYNGILVDDLSLHFDAYMAVAKDLNVTLNRDRLWSLISATPDEKKYLFGQISDAAWRDIRCRKDVHYYAMAAKKDIIIHGSVEILKSLSRSYPLALVSNTSRRYFEKCFPKDGRDCFTETLFSEEMEIPKPSPDPLLRILKRLDVTVDECCYVGDAISDVRMAKSAGVKMVGVTTGHHPGDALKNAGADWILNDLSEFAARIQAGQLP